MESQENLSKQEKLALKKQMKFVRFTALGRKEKIASFLGWAVFILILAGLFGYIGWDIFRPLSGTQIPILSREHVQDGEHPEYNSNPPTSGNHYAQPEEWGIYDRELRKERLVHNLEHSGIVVYYRCPETEAGCPELIESLKNLAGQLIKKDRKVLLAKSSEINSRIALSAWGWYDAFDVFDEDRIWNFFRDHVNKGPERVL